MRQLSIWFRCVVVIAVLMGAVAPALLAQQEQAAPTQQPAQSGLRLVPTTRLTFSSPAVEGVFWRGLKMLQYMYWITIACHVLLAVVVLLDIRRRGEGNPLFVFLTLLGGFLAAGVYGIFRIGDRKTQTSPQ